MSDLDFKLRSPMQQLDDWIRAHEAKFGTTPASVRMPISDWWEIKKQALRLSPCVMSALQIEANDTYCGVEVFTYVD